MIDQVKGTRNLYGKDIENVFEATRIYPGRK